MINFSPEIGVDLLRGIISLAVIIAIYIFINTILKKVLIKKVFSKKMKHNIIMFTSLVSYLFLFLSIIFLVMSYTGGFVGVGITAGLLTAALGWALQRPITGIAAWIMVILTKPFEIGDRIIIGQVKGDVSNITLTHIYLNEFGGTVGGDEISGREIIIPNAVLFEQNVVNYTAQSDFILDEVGFTITYKSHIDIAKSIAKKVTEKATKDFITIVPLKPFVRINFQASGIDVRIRYYTIASKRQEINSRITEEIFKEIMKEKKIDFAFPHTQVVFDKK
ncbi:MAG: mechanosensitive ion channel family protein [Nanoarchaeota archaeon]|nr:mechanosensitive ion channel family protein [Nanoarchaeota archaeon]